MEISLVGDKCFLCKSKTTVLKPSSSKRFVHLMFNTFFEDGDKLRQEMRDVTKDKELCITCAYHAEMSSNFKIEYEDKYRSEETITLPKCLFCRTLVRLIDTTSLSSEYKAQVELFMNLSSLPEFDSVGNVCLYCLNKLQLWSETRAKIVALVHGDSPLNGTSVSVKPTETLIEVSDGNETIEVEEVNSQNNNEQDRWLGNEFSLIKKKLVFHTRSPRIKKRKRCIIDSDSDDEVDMINSPCNFKKFKKQLVKNRKESNLKSTPLPQSKCTPNLRKNNFKHLNSVKQLEALGLLRVDKNLFKDTKFTQIPYVRLLRRKSMVSYIVYDSEDERDTTSLYACQICDRVFKNKLESQIHELWHQKPEKLVVKVARDDLQKLKAQLNSQSQIEDIACKYLNVSRLPNIEDKSMEVTIDTFESNSNCSFATVENIAIENILEKLSDRLLDDEDNQSDNGGTCIETVPENEINNSDEYFSSKENDINENNKKCKIGILSIFSNRVSEVSTPTPKKVQFSEP